MKIKYQIIRVVEGDLQTITQAIAPADDAPTMEELLQTMRDLCFIVETVAHLQGKERQLLPTADKARKQIEALESQS